MGVRSHKYYIFRFDVPKHTHHYRAQLICAGGKDCLFYTFRYFRSWNYHFQFCFRLLFFSRIFVTVDSDKLIITVVILQVNLKIIVVDLKHKTLIRQLLQQFKHSLYIDSYRSFSLAFQQFHSCRNGIFLVRASRNQHIVLYRKKEVVQYGNCVFLANHFAHCRQMRQQRLACNCKFHIFVFLISYPKCPASIPDIFSLIQK